MSLFLAMCPSGTWKRIQRKRFLGEFVVAAEVAALLLLLQERVVEWWRDQKTEVGRPAKIHPYV